MKKIFVSLLFAIPAVASAQSVFTVETEGKKYSFPLESTVITVTDELPSQLIELPPTSTIWKRSTSLAP